MECLLRNIIYTLVEQLENVLILILMECLLRVLARYGKENLLVLILILMECLLRKFLILLKRKVYLS